MNTNANDPQVQDPSAADVSASTTPHSVVVRPSDPAPRAPESGLQRGSILLFRVAGIDVFLHWSWFFFALLRLQSTSTSDPLEFAHYDSQLWYLVEYLALFVFVLLHEFGHVLACRSVGGIANSIILWPLGGIALVDPPARPGALLWSIAAGPLVNAVLVVPTVTFWLVSGAAGWKDTAPDLYQFAAALAWMNGYLLVFNVLPVFPLDGGRILQALLWFVMGRARSLQLATAVGLLTTLGLLVVAIVERSVVWGILAGLGVLFSLIGLQGARGLIRMLEAPRLKEAACPSCGAAPPIGKFWACLHCWMPFDVFANGGNCPICSTPQATVLCAECGQMRPYPQWRRDIAATATLAAAPRPASTPQPPTLRQRVLCGLIGAFFALTFCGLPNADNQPLGLIVWTVGGAILGVTTAGAITGTFRRSRALRQVCRAWRLMEADGQSSADGTAEERLILKYASYERRIGERCEERGGCWFDPLAEPPAISFTPKAGTDAEPRQGIYRLDGKTLTVCLAYPGHPRPTDFVAQPGVQEVRHYGQGKSEIRSTKSETNRKSE